MAQRRWRRKEGKKEERQKRKRDRLALGNERGIVITLDPMGPLLMVLSSRWWVHTHSPSEGPFISIWGNLLWSVCTTHFVPVAFPPIILVHVGFYGVVSWLHLVGLVSLKFVTVLVWSVVHQLLASHGQSGSRKPSLAARLGCQGRPKMAANFLRHLTKWWGWVPHH